MLTRNSPIITPISVIEILIFKLLIIILYADGITKYLSFFILDAFKESKSFKRYLSVDKKPLCIVNMLMISVIDKAMIIILFLPAPNNIMNSGPNAILGIEFKMVKNGSSILNIILNWYKKIAIKRLKVILNTKAVNVSFNVTKIWLNRLPVLYRFIIHLKIFDGDEKIKELIIFLLDEPFAALDYQSRLSISKDVYELIKDNNITTIIITHDISEAISLSDKVIVLSKRPCRIKKIYDINLNNKINPIKNRKDDKFSFYYELIAKDLDLFEK